MRQVQRPLAMSATDEDDIKSVPTTHGEHWWQVFKLVHASVVDLHGVTPSPLSSCHCILKFLFDANVFVAAHSHFAAIISIM